MPFEVHRHYNCQISDITTSPVRITPTWHRVSQTPWGAKSSKTSGYGRPIIRCAISDDMPNHFIRTEHLKRPEDMKDLPKQDFKASASIQASLVLPGAGSTLAARPAHGNRINKLNFGNQVLVEPYKTPRDNASFFNWSPCTSSRSPSRAASARSSMDTSRPTGRALRSNPNHSNCPRPANSGQEYARQFPSSSRIASARSTGRRDGGASNRPGLHSR